MPAARSRRSFDERDDAVKAMLAMAIAACRKAGKYAGICGQGPSDHPDLAQWLVAQGIESISLNPDTVVATWLLLAGEGSPHQELALGPVPQASEGVRSAVGRREADSVPRAR